MFSPLPQVRADWNATFQSDDSVTASAASIFSMLPRGGALPVIVSIENPTGSPRKYEINVSSTRGYGENQIKTAAMASVVAPPESKVATSLLLPIAPLDSGHRMVRNTTVQLSGPGIDGGSNRVNFPTSSTGHPSSTGFVAMSAALHVRSWAPIHKELDSRKVVLLGSRFESGDLPTDWRALSGVSQLWMTGEEFDLLRPEQVATVFEWIDRGGQFFWVLHNESDRTLAEFGATNPSLDRLEQGLGAIHRTRWDGRELPTGNTSTAVADGAPQLENQLASGYSTNWVLADFVGKIGFPVALLVSFLTIFAIVVGPVNLFVFAGSGWRHRLFWTTPAISVGASLLLVGIILFQDGIGGRGDRTAIMVLFPESGRMLVRQEQVARTGLLLSRSFEVDEQALVNPISLTVAAPTEPGGQLIVDGPRFAGDWFASRRVTAQFSDVIIPSRARVERIADEDGRPVVVSSIPHRLSKLLFTDEAGSMWIGGPIETGQAVQLEPAAENVRRKFILDGTEFAGPAIEATWRHRPAAPSTFLAIADDGPFLETLPSIRWKNRSMLVRGPVIDKSGSSNL